MNIEIYKNNGLNINKNGNRRKIISFIYDHKKLKIFFPKKVIQEIELTDEDNLIIYGKNKNKDFHERKTKRTQEYTRAYFKERRRNMPEEQKEEIRKRNRIAYKLDRKIYNKRMAQNT